METAYHQVSLTQNSTFNFLSIPHKSRPLSLFLAYICHFQVLQRDIWSLGTDIGSHGNDICSHGTDI